MKDLIEQIKNIWKNMDTTRRWIVVVAVLLVIGAMILILVLTRPPKYETLFTGLNEKSRSKVMNQLDDWRIDFRETPTGGIEVLNAARVRARLLQVGLPGDDSVGWEIFDKSDFGATDFDNKVKMQRAIEGELAQTLGNFTGITNAKVMLNTYDDADYMFSDEKPDSTASVTLNLQEEGILSQAQVTAILNLVKNATGIKEENITILDNNANDLSAAVRYNKKKNFGEKFSGEDILAERAYYTKLYTDDIKNKIERQINSLGKVKCVAAVTAELDLDYLETKRELFDNKGVPRSEQHKSESFEGTNSGNIGIPGTDSNTPQYKEYNNDPTYSSGSKSEDTINYEISNEQQFLVNAPGRVRIQHVSVLVNKDLTPLVTTQIADLVRSAAGIRPERGDTVSVQAIEIPDPPEPAQKEFPWTTVIAASVLGLLLLVLIILVIVKEPAPRVIEKRARDPKQKSIPESSEFMPQMEKNKPDRRSRRKETEVEEMPVPIIGTKVDKLIEDRAHLEHAAGFAPGQDVISTEPEITPEERLRNERLKAIEKMAEEKPDEVAALLKAWLSEEI